MDIWERGLHAGLVGNAKAKGAAREGKDASGGEEKYDTLARSYPDTIFSGKLRQPVLRETNR